MIQEYMMIKKYTVYTMIVHYCCITVYCSTLYSIVQYRRKTVVLLEENALLRVGGGSDQQTTTVYDRQRLYSAACILY